MSMLANTTMATMAATGPNANRPGNASVKEVTGTQLRDLEKSLPLRVLSDADFKHWQTYGFVVVKMPSRRNRSKPPSISSGNFRKWIRMIRQAGPGRKCATMP